MNWKKKTGLKYPESTLVSPLFTASSNTYSRFGVLELLRPSETQTGFQKWVNRSKWCWNRLLRCITTFEYDSFYNHPSSLSFILFHSREYGSPPLWDLWEVWKRDFHHPPGQRQRVRPCASEEAASNSNSKLLDVRQHSDSQTTTNKQTSTVETLFIIMKYSLNHKHELSVFSLIFVMSSFGKHSHDELSILVPLTQCCRSELFLTVTFLISPDAECVQLVKYQEFLRYWSKISFSPRLSSPAGWEGRPTFVCSC